MRRTAIAVVAFAVVALGVTGCSSSPDQVTASMVSPPRPEAPSELAPLDPGGPSDLSDPFGELPEGFEDFGSGIDDMFDQFESQLGVAGECLELLMKYAELMASSFGALPGSNGRDAVAGSALVESARIAANGRTVSAFTSSPPTTSIRVCRPSRMSSSAQPSAWLDEAHAATKPPTAPRIP